MKKYKEHINESLKAFLMVSIALFLSVALFWLVFKPEFGVVRLPDGDSDTSIGYIESGSVRLEVPSADIDVSVELTDGSQESVDKYDVVQDRRCENIRLLGHAGRTFGNLKDIIVGDNISFGDGVYVVIYSGTGQVTSDKTNVVADDSGKKLLGRADLEMITCYGLDKSKRWVVLASEIYG